jgi:hypothetical protein
MAHSDGLPAGFWPAALGTTFVLHYAWEVAQAPLYHQCGCGDAASVSERLPRCLQAAGGDVVLASAAYVPVGLAFQDAAWPASREWWRPAALWLLTGLGATALAERLALGRGWWAYAPTHPTVLGIGLMPLLQWTLIPLLTLAVLKAGARTCRLRQSSA